VQIDRVHENAIRMREILELASNLMSPFFTVKEIVPKAIHDDQKGGSNLAGVRSLVFRNPLHELRLRLIGFAKVGNIRAHLLVSCVPVMAQWKGPQRNPRA
jgi:hypothetical protein